MPSWESWARTVPNLKQSERLILRELAALVDSRGVTKARIDYLQTTTGCSRRTIFRALAGLEERGLITREQARDKQGHWQTSRIQLIRTTATQAATDRPNRAQTPVPLPSIPADLEPPALDNHELKGLITTAANENWRGKATGTLAAILQSEGPRRFGRIIHQRRTFNDADDQWDTLALAWEQLQTGAGQLLQANSVWALWSTMLAAACSREDQNRRDDKENQNHLTDNIDTLAANPEPIPTQAGESHIGLDDISEIEPINQFVNALIEEGINETIAWSATSIVASRITQNESGRHTLVGNDARLHNLGIPPAAARAWMSALVGTRRGKPGISNQNPEDIKKWAHQIAKQTTQTL